MKATVRAHANIAFIKYWGVRDRAQNLPFTDSLSMTLSGVHSTTTLEWVEGEAGSDEILLNDRPATGDALVRTLQHLERLRPLLGLDNHCRMASVNNFPAGAGIASSASGFCALTLAAAAAAGCRAGQSELPKWASLARLASGSACRSFWGGFAEWKAGHDTATSVAGPLHSEGHWKLADVVALISSEQKRVSSHSGHELAASSFLWQDRLRFVEKALPEARLALARRDLSRLGPLAERETLWMHAVMLTSRTPLLYLNRDSVRLMEAVRAWREDEGIQVFFTADAGPNLHLLCEVDTVEDVVSRLSAIPFVTDLIVNWPGPGPRQLDDHLF